LVTKKQNVKVATMLSDGIIEEELPYG